MQRPSFRSPSTHLSGGREFEPWYPQNVSSPVQEGIHSEDIHIPVVEP